jgi:hypothetical protein
MKTPLDTRGGRTNDGRSARLGKKQPDGTHGHRIAHPRRSCGAAGGRGKADWPAAGQSGASLASHPRRRPGPGWIGTSIENDDYTWRADIYAALATASPLTADELAARCRIDPRYAREWAYPLATVVGVDLDEASIAEANKNAAASGVGQRVSFRVADASDPSLAGTFDLVCAFETIHDMNDPTAALASISSRPTSTRESGSSGDLARCTACPPP